MKEHKAAAILHRTDAQPTKEFLNLGRELVAQHVDADHPAMPQTAEDLENISNEWGIFMEIGANYKRNQYIFAGLVIGVVGAIAVNKLIGWYKGRKNENK